MIPDFGEKAEDFESGGHKIQLVCKYMAPGLTFHAIMKAYYEAEKECKPGDELSGNPGKWPGARGVNAVLKLVLEAVYKDKH